MYILPVSQCIYSLVSACFYGLDHFVNGYTYSERGTE